MVMFFSWVKKSHCHSKIIICTFHSKSKMICYFIGVYKIKRPLHELLEIQNFSSHMLKISRLFAALTHEISSWTLKGKIHIYLRLCNILYVSFSAELYKWLLSEVVSVADYSVKMFLRIKISWLVPRNVQNVLYLLKAAHSCRLRHGW